MRWISVGVVVLCLADGLIAAEAPLVEKYLHSGQLAKGQQVLESALDATPIDDELRFSLAFLKFVRGVERLGQSLHQYGCRSENTRLPFVRLPIPTNPDPSQITYADFRRILIGFQNELGAVETLLAAVTDEGVTLPLRLADVHLDLDGDGLPTDTLTDILRKLMRSNPEFKDNPGLLVCFDRGDVAWLRAYCHLLMGLIDFQLAFDLEQSFNITADELFAKPKTPFKGSEKQKVNRLIEAGKIVTVSEPARLNHFRLHLLAVCELNHETWKFIRAERDDDHEWLPNSKQKGVIGLPVTDAMIDAWLGMINEVSGLLDGKKVIPAVIVGAIGPSVDDGFSIRKLLEDPPAKFEWERIAEEGPAVKYLDKTAKDVDMLKIIRVGQVFQNSLGVAYAAWFN
jgi:hypothetical protein